MANYKVLATWDISIQNLYKDITLIQQGISCKLNISLRSISRVTVNYKVGNEYVTDLCTIDLDNNKVIVPFKKNVLEVGANKLELVCHMKNGDVLVSPTYIYDVIKSLDNTNDITEEDAYPVLIGMIQELTEKEVVIQANEEARANAEMYRELNEDERQNAEAERKANENIRINNENTRQSNESNRQQYETQRRVEEDERLTDEQVRINAENIRIANENERLRKEIERQNAEELRQIAYNSSLYARMDEAEDRLDAVDSQLAHIENKQFITPEDFEGTDHDKLQQALDYAISNKIDLCINKKYEVDKELVINKKSEARYKTRIFGGGTIIRNGNGNIFSALNKSTSDIYFEGLSFEGLEDSNVTCFNCGDANLIRFKIDKCHFSNLDYVVYTQSYLQTVYITNSTFIKINNSVLEFGGLFDVKISNIVYEYSKGQFLNHLKIGEYSGCQSFSLRDSVLEGITGENDLIRISNPYGFLINSCYFEANKGKNIVFFNAYECAGVNISNNIHMGTTDDKQAFITWSGILHDCITSCNSISGIKINDTTNITKGRVISQGDFCALSDQNITSNNTDIIKAHESNITTNINKTGTTNFIVSSECGNVVDETLICTINTPVNSGFNISIKGGGLQGDIGMFSINCNYHVTKYNNNYTISEITSSSFGSANQHNGVICRENNGKISIYAKSLNRIASSYFLTIYVDGQVSSVETP